ncbi:hypothetical protein EVAR_95618_1 [Eumeta japonica]|uniref:Mos1 transposase HTH domain-containing protein n=1 Tax=Eumeta variegata TaxID=151549 RepID=A0A4C1VIS1_EUMVA|nr:hypothetical protein EVAR_95618_1 [Eumeta japonica]
MSRVGRHIALYIQKGYGEGSVICKDNFTDIYILGKNSIIAQNWFKHYESGNFDVEHEPRCRRLVTDKVDAILDKVEKHRHINSCDMRN